MEGQDMDTSNVVTHFKRTAEDNHLMPHAQRVLIAVLVSFLPTMSAFAQGGGSASVSPESVIATSTPIAVAFMISMLVLKVTAFVLGYLIVKLGHDTMIRGVTGEVDFGFSGSGFETKLKSASPGAFFILMGAAIIIWGIMVDKPFTIEVPSQQSTAADPRPSESASGLHRPEVPD
jgi:hypothetical protein